MHAFARGAKCGARTIIGPVPACAVASKPSFANSDANASVPSPLAEVARKSRRVSWVISLGLISGPSWKVVEIGKVLISSACSLVEFEIGQSNDVHRHSIQFPDDSSGIGFFKIAAINFG